MKRNKQQSKRVSVFIWDFLISYQIVANGF